MPDAQVCLLTEKNAVHSKLPEFDTIVEFPWGDLAADTDWKLSNDWQAYWASPYTYTIKIEADFYIPRRIDHWWSILEQVDIAVCTTVRDYHGKISSSRFYRKIFDDNKLPDAYNGLTYFRKSPLAEKFYTVVKDIFTNWPKYRATLKCRVDEPATTDVVYAMAMNYLGVENCTLPGFSDFSFIHMKKGINGGKMEDWTKEYIYEVHPSTIRIGTVPALYPLHYHIKNFAEILEEEFRV